MRTHGRREGDALQDWLEAERAIRKDASSKWTEANRPYHLAERRGFEPGHEMEDWLNAEAQVFAEIQGLKASRPHAVLKTTLNVLEVEKRLGRRPRSSTLQHTDISKIG
jgi:hypothetical protein